MDVSGQIRHNHVDHRNHQFTTIIIIIMVIIVIKIIRIICSPNQRHAVHLDGVRQQHFHEGTPAQVSGTSEMKKSLLLKTSMVDQNC